MSHEIANLLILKESLERRLRKGRAKRKINPSKPGEMEYPKRALHGYVYPQLRSRGVDPENPVMPTPVIPTGLLELKGVMEAKLTAAKAKKGKRSRGDGDDDSISPEGDIKFYTNALRDYIAPELKAYGIVFPLPEPIEPENPGNAADPADLHLEEAAA